MKREQRKEYTYKESGSTVLAMIVGEEEIHKLINIVHRTEIK